MNRILPWSLALLLVGAWPARPAEESADQRLERLERRMAELENRYQQQLEQRDQEIARLRALVEAGGVDQGDQGATSRPAAGTPDSLRDSLLAELDRATPAATAAATQRVLEDAQRRADGLAGGRGIRVAASANPDIAVITNFVGSLARARRNPALNRFDVGELELDIRSAVHPNADAVAILALARDVEHPVFAEGEELEGPETSVAIEEAYLFLHNFGIPNLTAKLGRFHVRFGRQNFLHTHDLPTTAPPLVNQAFLAPEALGDAGLSLSWVVPNPWDQYIEIVAEILSGEGAGSESPTLAGDLNVQSPAFNLHALWNTDIGRDWNLELGASWLHGRPSNDIHRQTNLFGADVTLIHRDPTGRFNNQLFQAEMIQGIVDDEDNITHHAWGAYLLAQQQLTRDWYTGVRLDYTQNPFDRSQEAWAVSPYLTFYWSEFLRFRVEYQHRGGDVPSEDAVYFQVTWIFGAHPPHPYWSMR